MVLPLSHFSDVLIKNINDRSLADTEITVQGNLYLVDNSISGCH